MKAFKLLTPIEVGYNSPEEQDLESALKLIAQNIKNHKFVFKASHMSITPALSIALSNFGWKIESRLVGSQEYGDTVYYLKPIG